MDVSRRARVRLCAFISTRVHGVFGEGALDSRRPPRHQGGSARRIFVSCTALTLGAVLMASMPSSSIAAPPNAVDARTIDVAGIRTGMSYDEAVAAAAAHFAVDAAVIESKTRFRVNPVSQNQQPSHLVYESSGERLIVSFVARSPADADRPYAVSMVRFQASQSDADCSSLQATLVDRYGQPSFDGGRSRQWCAHPKLGGCKSGPTQGVLESDSACALVLSDPALTQAAIRTQQSVLASSPDF